MRLLQVNSTVSTGSTGRLAEQVGQFAIQQGHESYIAFGRGTPRTSSRLVRIGNARDVIMHGLKTRVLDRNGFGSTRASVDFIRQVHSINPDVIGLHNLHGYYVNVHTLFNYIKAQAKPVVWTLHDAWAFTGHCAYFDPADCQKWRDKCGKCPLKRMYPASLLLDNSRRNFLEKRDLFRGIGRLQLITPSRWLAVHVKNSFLSAYPLRVIHNGVDLGIFRPVDSVVEVSRRFDIKGRKIVLGVSNIWSERKGLRDFVLLSKQLGKRYRILLVGLTPSQLKGMPADIIGITRTESVTQLAQLYSAADVFVNPTYADNFPTTNIESLACGTPIVTYRTGGSPEAVDENTGITVRRGDINALAGAIQQVCDSDRDSYRNACRSKAEKFFDKDQQISEYLKVCTDIMQ